jgi:hypothetical protein
MSAIRNYSPSDLEHIKRIHKQNALDFALPNLNKFPVHKVLEIEGVVRATYGMRVVLESNLWLDRTEWTDSEGKWLAIKTLDKAAVDSAEQMGFDSVQCFLPPGYEKFGRRICGKDGLGFSPDRPGWLGLGKFIGAHRNEVQL